MLAQFLLARQREKHFAEMQKTRNAEYGDTELFEIKCRCQASFGRKRAPERTVTGTVLSARIAAFSHPRDGERGTF